MGREKEPPSIDIINKRLSTKASERAQQAMRLSHSRIPGQCTHKDSVKIKEPAAESQLSVISPRVPDMTTEPCIFELKEKNGLDGKHSKIMRYTSVKDYEAAFCKPENMRKLKGCFQKDGVSGQINLSSFRLSIKSLVSDYAYQNNLNFSEWRNIAGFLKTASANNYEEPQQLVGHTVALFEKKALKDNQDQFDYKQLGLHKFGRNFRNSEK